MMTESSGGQPDGTPASEQKPKTSWVGCLGLVVVVVILFWVASLFGGDGGGGGDDGGGEFGARDVCEQFVEDRLKSPATADFSDTEAIATGIESWTVTGSVDAENSFGAKIRNTYVCKVTHTSGVNWHLNDLAMSGG